MRARPAIASPAVTVELDELREEPLILMQDGAGVRQVVEDELRRRRAEGPRSRRPSRARSAGVGAERGPGRLRRRLHLARGGRVRARGRNARRGARRGLDLAREICIVASRRPRVSRAAEAFVAFARERLNVIVRWGLEELPGLLDELGIERPFLVARPRWTRSGSPATAALDQVPPPGRPSREGVDGVLARRRREHDRHRQGGLGRAPACRSSPSRPPTRAPSGRRASASARGPPRRSAAARAPASPGSSTTRS